MNEIREVVFQFYHEFSRKAKGDNTDEKKGGINFATKNGNDLLNEDAEEGYNFINHPNFTVKWFVIADKWR
tara:strand:+ start:743 stop:955 length:213 start_codon:yes stop_codon:yes gene_type:complete